MLCLIGAPSIAGVHAGDDSRDGRRTAIRALAPVEVLASGFETLAGIAVSRSGAVFVTDREAGTLTRLDEGGRRVILRGLRRPTGVAIDGTGAPIVLDRGGRQLLRLGIGGVEVISSALSRARSVAVGPDGRIWVAMGRARGRDRRENDFFIARLDEAGTPTPFVSGLVDVEGIAVDGSAVYLAMARLARERGSVRTSLARVPIRPDGTAGPVEPLLHDAPYRPRAVAIDAAGAVLVSDAGGRVIKWQRDGSVGALAANLGHPVALAFAPDGDLVVAERDEPGRVLRFNAPPAPAVSPAPFTNQTTLAMSGESEPGTRVTVTHGGSAGSLLASAIANAVTGGFAVHVPMESNASNDLTMMATGVRGAGLSSQPLALEIVHDDVPPSLMMIEPVAGVHTRGAIVSSARASDDGSGVAAVLWSIDGVDTGRVKNGAPEGPFTAVAALATATLAEGPHGLDVVAIDRAGNERTAGVPILVDRTPPETTIASAPAPETVPGTATFTVSGTDAWSAVEQLDYAWRLDQGAWSHFNGLTTITFSDLRPGEHRFEARARDRAGNEDATPAVQTFTVRSLSIRILEPAPGTVITAGSVWVRAIVEGGTGEVTVSVPLPSQSGVDAVSAQVQGDTVAMLLPVDPSVTSLTVMAIDARGATVQADVPVVVSGAAAFEPSLDLWPAGGLAPLTVRFGLRGWSGFQVAVDIEGDGTAEFEGQAGADDFYATFEGPGVYVPTVRITTALGEVLTRRGIVEVYDRAVLDARLQAVWGVFKDALRSADVTAAVAFIAVERRAPWAEFFSALPAEAFADVDRIFTTMTFVEAGYRGAQYEMLAERDGLLYSYAVWFRIDDDGRWRLWRF